MAGCEPNKVAAHSECKCIHRNQVSGVRGPKHLKLAMASHRAAFSGNTSLIVTFSSRVSVTDNFIIQFTFRSLAYLQQSTTRHNTAGFLWISKIEQFYWMDKTLGGSKTLFPA